MASQFGPEFNAVSFAYGVDPNVPAIQVLSGATASGAYTLTLYSGFGTTSDGKNFKPFNTNAPILIGEGSSSETVTPSAVSNTTPQALGTCLVTATFAQAHGIGDQVRSGTVGLQECINFVAGYGGGVVLLDARWSQLGGTSAMISAAVLPANVSIQDSRAGGAAIAGNVPASVSQLAAPTALTTATSANGMITTAATGGTISNATYRLGVTYVDIFGGETTLSIDTASTATIATTGTTSTITVTSPAALTGAVGYKVYMTAAAGASLSEILYPQGNAAITGTASTVPGAPASFAIGTPVTINAIITGTATVPTVNSAFASATASAASPAAIVSYPPFAVLASVAAAATSNLATVNLPAGFLNQLGRTIRIKGMYYATTNSTPGTLTTKLNVASVPGVTSITPFSVVSGTTTASAVVSAIYEIVVETTAVGTSGTLEVHGTVAYNLAGTAVSSLTQDIIIAASSAVNLTVADQLNIQLTPTTTATTNTQNRLLTIEVLQ